MTSCNHHERELNTIFTNFLNKIKSMKAKIFLLAAVAATMSLASCSNDEDLNGKNLNGNGAVSVKIVSPQTRTRAVQNGTTENDNVTVTGTITVELTADEGGKSIEVTADGNEHTVWFYDVKGPKKIEAYINNGKAKAQGDTDIDDLDLQVVPASIPAYGSTEAIHLAGETVQNNGKTYEKYDAKVTMVIPFARLEVSGIKHVTHHVDGDADEADCKYATLTINGIYLDKVKVTETGEIVDYAMGTDIDGNDEKYPILSDVITEASFLDENSVWPTKPDQVYAYNFYPDSDPAKQPVLKIYFENATAIDPDETFSEPRYAIISSYNNDENFTFQAGHIYRIKNVTLKDKNIIGDEEGNTLYAVDVTVEEATWSVTDLNNVEWIEQ